MPIYEYQCEKCGEVFEVTQKMSDPPLDAHDSCGSKKVKKLISSTSFQLKGAGWYVTDYKKSTDKKSDTGEAKPEAKPDTKSETKSGEKAGEKKDEKKASKKKDTEAA